MATTSNEPNQPAKQPVTINALLKSDHFKNAVTAALPKHLSPERFIRVALNAVMRKPQLLQCTQESFFLCLLDLSVYGLEPDGRRAHLIPFKNTKECICGHPLDQHKGQNCSVCACKQRTTRVDCTLIIDYKGIAECVRRSGDVSYIHADVVYEKDHFEFKYGTGAMLEHVPAKDRGDKKLWAYSFVKLRDGSEDFIVLSIDEVDKVRKRSKAATDGPWVTDYDEMAKKTAFRRHSKWLPLKSEIRDVIERDDDIIDVDTDSAFSMAGQISTASERAIAMPERASEAEDKKTAVEEKPKAQSDPEKKDSKVSKYDTFDLAPDSMRCLPGTLIEIAGKIYTPSEDQTAWQEVKAAG